MFHQCRVPQLFHRTVRNQIKIGGFNLSLPLSKISAEDQSHICQNSKQKNLRDPAFLCCLSHRKCHNDAYHEIQKCHLRENKRSFFSIFQKLAVKDCLCSDCLITDCHMAEFFLLLLQPHDHFAVFLPPDHFCIGICKFCRVLIIISITRHPVCQDHKQDRRQNVQNHPCSIEQIRT